MLNLFDIEEDIKLYTFNGTHSGNGDVVRFIIFSVRSCAQSALHINIIVIIYGDGKSTERLRPSLSLYAFYTRSFNLLSGTVIHV